MAKMPVLCRIDPLTLRYGAADSEGGQGGAQAVDGIIEMLSKEYMVFHGLAGQSVQLLPPGKAKVFLVYPLDCFVLLQ